MASEILKRWRKLLVELTGVSSGVTIPTTPQNTLTLLGSTTTPLGGAGIFIGATHSQAAGGYNTVRGTCTANQAGTLMIAMSGNGGTNFDGTVEYNLAANETLMFSVDITAPHFHIVYTNGAAAQATFRLYWFGSTV